MKRLIRIDKAVYEVDDETRTYRFCRRNPDWEDLDPDLNETNKRTIDGFTRILRDGRKQIFKYFER
jgi:hypothetical protein